MVVSFFLVMLNEDPSTTGQELFVVEHRGVRSVVEHRDMRPIVEQRDVSDTCRYSSLTSGYWVVLSGLPPRSPSPLMGAPGGMAPPLLVVTLGERERELCPFVTHLDIHQNKISQSGSGTRIF